MKKSELVKLLNNLPHSFDKEYWNLADTSYKEEILVSALDTGLIDAYHAQQIVIDMFDSNPKLIGYIRRTHESVMGRYIKKG